MHRRTGTRSSPNPRSQGSQQRVLSLHEDREKNKDHREKRAPRAGERG